MTLIPLLLLTSLTVAAMVVAVAVIAAMKLRARPVMDPQRVVVVTNTAPASDEPVDLLDQSLVARLREHPGFLGVSAQLAASGSFADFRPSIVLENQESVEGVGVSSEYFSVLGVEVAGRAFHEVGGDFESEDVVVISSRLRDKMARLGQQSSSLMLRSGPARIIGITNHGFHGARRGEQIDVWLPIRLAIRNSPLGAGPSTDAERAYLRAPHFVLARLKDGVGFRDIEAGWAKDAARLTVRPLAGVYGTPDRPTLLVAENDLLWTVGLAVALMLVTGLCSVVGLVQAYAENRQDELATEWILGIPRRWSVLKGLTPLISTIPLVIAVALLTARLGIHLAAQLVLPSGIALDRIDLSLDRWAIASAAIMASVVICAGGLLPLLQATTPASVSSVLRGRGNQATSSRRVWRWLHVGQAAVAAALVAGSLSLSNTMGAVVAEKVGFDLDTTILVRLQPSIAQWSTNLQIGDVLRNAVDGIGSLPGIRAASIGPWPIHGRVNELRPRTVSADGRTQQINVNVTKGDAAYVSALDVGLVAGEPLASTESERNFVLVTEGLGRRVWPDSGPNEVVGRSFKLQGVEYHVRGVVRNFAQGALVGATEAGVIAYEAKPSTGRFVFEIVISSSVTGGTVARELRQHFERAFPLPARLEIATAREVLNKAMGRERSAHLLLSMFGLAAAGLAIGGVYGSTRSLIHRGAREIGIRAALGASPGRILVQYAVLENLPTLLGSLVGATLAGTVAYAGRSMFFELADPSIVPFALAAFFVSLAAATASCFATVRTASGPVAGLLRRS